MRPPLERLLTIGFEGTTPPAELLALIGAGLGGVVLFQRNIQNPAQLLALVGDLKEAAGARPLVVSIDQEGGRVARLRGAPWAEVPPMRRFGELPSETRLTRVRALAELLAAELAAVGIDLDFAPVLDVDTRADNPVIGDRSFSSRPERVAALGAEFIAAMQASGVAACGKHFPGHGDTAVDSHLNLPVITHERQRIEAVELLPFRAACRAGVAAVMTAHVLYEKLDAQLPATLSAPVLDILRRQIGFDGVIVSDDMNMDGVARRWPLVRSAPLAIAAGCDQLLVSSGPSHAQVALAALERALAEGALSERRVSEAADRWENLASGYQHRNPGPSALEWLGSAGHQAAVERALG